MKYSIRYTTQFKKSIKKSIKKGLDVSLLWDAVEILTKNGKLPAKYKPHKLSGNYANCWECHIKPDWLLIWEQNDDCLTLLFLNTGTHSELF